MDQCAPYAVKYMYVLRQIAAKRNFLIVCIWVPTWTWPDVDSPSVKTSSEGEQPVAGSSRLASSASQVSRARNTHKGPHDMDIDRASSSSSTRQQTNDEPMPGWTESAASSRATSSSPTKQIEEDSGGTSLDARLPHIGGQGKLDVDFPVLPPAPAMGPSSEDAAAPSPPIQLSDEQRAVLDMVKRGKNVFFTGSAGTGKSVLLREIIKHCRTGRWGRLAITASTGIASVNIGGSTIHSWAGIGLGKESAEKLVGKLLGQMIHWQKKNSARMPQDDDIVDDDAKNDVDFQFNDKKSPTVDRWKQVTTLIIDESMSQCTVMIQDIDIKSYSFHD